MDEFFGWRLRKGSGTLKLQITIDGKAYEVDVEVLEDEDGAMAPSRPTHHAPNAATQSFGGAWDSEGKVCQSPVTGLVIKVNVRPRQTVAAGELMLVLEAMKMETILAAPRAGVVQSVHIKPGDPVKVNQLLLEME